MMKSRKLRLTTTAVVLVVAATAHADVSFPVEITRDGRMSLAIYNADGQMVRTLATGKPVARGAHTMTWDGRDRYGNALPVGDYTWKLLANDGLRSEFITQVGQNVDPVWEKATGNHQAPGSAAVDATGLYRFGSVNEGAHWGVKTDQDGKFIWTNDRGAEDPWVHGSLSVTIIGGRLYELIPNGTVYGYEATTGEVFTGSDRKPKPWNFRWEGYVVPEGTKEEERRKLNPVYSPDDLAGDAAGDQLVAAYRRHDAVSWFDAKDGKLLDTATVLPKLAGIAVGKDGAVLAISQGAVVSFNMQSKTPRQLIPADKLDSPWRLCVSPVSGDIFVAENSELANRNERLPRHCQVKCFSADGKLLKSYGRPEGREDGTYVATDFRGLSDIESDHAGGFVITEGGQTPPRRSARFDAEGRLLHEWLGAQHYGVIVCPEPGDPRHVWFRSNADKAGLVRCEVDAINKSWKVVEIYQDVFAKNSYASAPGVPYLFAHDGRIYIHGGGVGPGGISLSIYDPVKKTLRPCNASGKKINKTFLWNDLNDDGLASDDEIEWLKRSEIGGAMNPADLTVITTPHATGYQPGHSFTPSRITPGGTPVYVAADAKEQKPWIENSRKSHPFDFRQGADGSWYGCFAESTSNPLEGTENHGPWYYNSCSAIDRLVKWDKDWKPLWSVGRHSSDNDHETGTSSMGRGLVGLAHGCVVWGDASDEEMVRPTVWTEDGLYVDELLRVPVDYMPKSIHGENNSNEYPMGHIQMDPKTGETFFYAMNSGGGAPIYRITGWNGWQRAEGTVKLSKLASPVARHDGSGLKGEYFNNANLSGDPAVTRNDKLVFFHWLQGLDKVPDGIDSKQFSARWTGQVEAPTSELYRFVFESVSPWRGGGWGTPGRPVFVKLWIGGNLVIDTTTGKFTETTYAFPQTYQGIYGEIPLQAGERYNLRLECSFAGNAVAKLCWETPGLDRLGIPPVFLHPEPGAKMTVETPISKRPEVIADIGFEEKDGALSWSRAGGDVFGRLTGNTRRVPGKIGSAIEFNAKGEFAPAVFPIDEELRLPDTDYTVAFWFKTTAKNLRLCEARRYTSYNNRWSDHIVSLAGGKVRFALQGDQPLETPDLFNDGQWHYVVTTVGSGGQRLHVDGQLIATGKITRRTKTSNRLGLDLGPGVGEGVVAMDEAKVFGRALTAAELKTGRP